MAEDERTQFGIGGPATNSWLTSLIESCDDAIISKSLDGVIQTWNPAAERIFGYSAAEIIGQPITRLLPQDRLDEEQSILAKIRAGERIDHFRTVRVRKDRSHFDISVTISPIRNELGEIVGASKIARDLGPEKRQRLMEARLAGIAEAALDCIVEMDASGRVTAWNPAAVAAFGFTREEAIGSLMAELIIPSKYRLQHQEGLARYLETGRHALLNKRLELVAVRKGGEEFPVELTITPTPSLESPLFTGFIRDISERKRHEADRESLLQSERIARAEADASSRIKDEFLATLSHELRTPLNAILGWAQVIYRDTGLPEDVAEGIAVIERNARAQSQIIEDLLDMSRIISGKLRLDVQPVDLASIVQSAVDTVRPAANAKKIRLQAIIDPLRGLKVSGDANRLQQIFWNLLSNAIKFTPKGGRVQVRLERINSHLEVCVQDTGEGIGADLLPYVFERFRQADASTTRQHGGLGLGLAIVKQLVEMHGGEVRAESSGLKLGSIFCVKLPLAAVHSEVELSRQHPRVNGPSRLPASDHDLTGLKILAVDDEIDTRALVKRLLEERGADVVTAGSVVEALSLLHNQTFHLLLSDIGMPGENGYDLIRMLRASKGPNSRVPAVALTAYARAEDRMKAVSAGYIMHLAKPVETAELITMVAAASSLSERRKS